MSCPVRGLQWVEPRRERTKGADLETQARQGLRDYRFAQHLPARGPARTRALGSHRLPPRCLPRAAANSGSCSQSRWLLHSPRPHGISRFVAGLVSTAERQPSAVASSRRLAIPATSRWRTRSRPRSGGRRADGRHVPPAFHRHRGKADPHRREMEPTLGFEPRTCCLRNSCSTAELCRPGGSSIADDHGHQLWEVPTCTPALALNSVAQRSNS
jgi:hypothetical protein